jgi:hypothetical protein
MARHCCRLVVGKLATTLPSEGQAVSRTSCCWLVPTGGTGVYVGGSYKALRALRSLPEKENS